MSETRPRLHWMSAGLVVTGAWAMLSSCEGGAGTAPSAPQAAPSASPPPTSSAAAVASVAPTVLPRVPHEPPLPPATPGSTSPSCRVMSLVGGVTASSGQAVRAGVLLDGASPLELGSGATLHLKHTQSGREWSVEGPARLSACPGGNEEIVLGEGTLRTELSAGARPGAQVLVGTPFGSVRYGDARLRLSVADGALRASVEAGEAWLVPLVLGEQAAGARAPKETRLTPATPVERGRGDRVTAALGVKACARDANAAETQAKALLTSVASGLGERAAAHVRARQRARASCAGAAAAVLQQTEGAARDARLAELGTYRTAWSGVPGSRN